MSSAATHPELLDLLDARLRQIGIVIPPDATPEQVIEIVAEQVAFVPTAEHLNRVNQLRLIDGALDRIDAPPAPPNAVFPVVERFAAYANQMNDRLLGLIQRLDAVDARQGS